MKTDVVYKLGAKSKHEDLELRYSLRSLSNFKDLNKVYIVGEKPEWVQNIIFIPQTDVFKQNKDANLINKLILASQDIEITNEFINFSDDQVLLRECSYEDFVIPYYDDSLIIFPQDQRLNRWKQRLKDSITTLQERGLPHHCYEAHIPTLLDKTRYMKTLFQYNYPEARGMCGNTLYFNTIKKIGEPLPKEFALRLEGPIEDYITLENMCKGKLHLNYSEDATNQTMLLFLEKTFPNKCQFEV